KPFVSGCKHIRRRWRGSDRTPKPVDLTAFEVDTTKQRDLHLCLAIFKQLVGLLRADNIPRKQNDACGLNTSQQGSQRRRHLRAVETDNEKLSELRLGADFQNEGLIP